MSDGCHVYLTAHLPLASSKIRAQNVIVNIKILGIEYNGSVNIVCRWWRLLVCMVCLQKRLPPVCVPTGEICHGLYQFP